jgi:ketosteroid isomerase-like protein
MSLTQETGRAASDASSGKALVVAFFAALSSDDTVTVNEIVDPAGDFWVLSHRRAVPASAWLDGFRHLIRDRAPGGVKFTVSTLTAEDDRVAAVVECHAAFDDGRVYQNMYHFLIRVDGGRIAQLWEYGDTLHAERVLRGK